MPSAHRPIFCRKGRREKVGVNVFYRSESAHKARLFIADKTSDLPYNFLSRCHLAHTYGSIFYRNDNGRQGPIVGLRHSDFLSDQKSAHTNRFSLRFLSTMKNRSVCAGHYPIHMIPLFFHFRNNHGISCEFLFNTNITSWVCLVQSRSISLQTIFQNKFEKILSCDRALFKSISSVRISTFTTI